jgi:hypothetical protein
MRTYTYAGIIWILIRQAHGPNASGVVRGVRPDRLGLPPMSVRAIFLGPQL